MNKDAMMLIRIHREIENELDAIRRVVNEYASVPDNIEDWIQSAAAAE